MFAQVSLVALSLAAYSSAICTKTYTVKSGDGCDAIALANNVSQYQLQKLNGNNICLLLTPGQSICLTDSTYDCQPVHAVVSGETCSAIAQSNGITLSKFLSNNAQLDPNTCPIYPGLNVCVDPDSTNPGGDCTRTTEIQAGDTCDAIAGRNGISTYIIQQINPGNTCAGLLAFTQICVDSPANNCAKIYTVTGNEGGCDPIATAQGITFTRLRELNPNIDAFCGNIYPGEVLCVQSK
ncbi:hypothetical protein E1B28_002159 [Marasmius oreades]|uniref:LysM domain-containing protein n=1 Tax=Marasmius oreades TaxID=181124 RepID=A0A9P7RN31_9AGAR|nr:uncharacterized protein E1B28_002159 [Marasmius oreades]KAG7086196.1 hypothetical protein E1B28_002159 [Marasmius oreades]